MKTLVLLTLVMSGTAYADGWINIASSIEDTQLHAKTRTLEITKVPLGEWVVSADFATVTADGTRTEFRATTEWMSCIHRGGQISMDYRSENSALYAHKWYADGTGLSDTIAKALCANVTEKSKWPTPAYRPDLLKHAK